MFLYNYRDYKSYKEFRLTIFARSRGIWIYEKTGIDRVYCATWSQTPLIIIYLIVAFKKIVFFLNRETPTASGPNSYGKGKQGFVDRHKVIEKQLKEEMDRVSGDKEDGKA